MGRDRFADRAEAGKVLGHFLLESGHAPPPPAVVLGLARGGVPVAAPVAGLLGCPLDVLVVRKLGVPGREELAMGAIAGGGVEVLNEDVIAGLRIPPEVIEEVARRESEVLEGRLRAYRGDRPAAELAGRTVVLVDDGLATGSTMRAAVRAVRAAGAGFTLVAAPVASRSAVHRLRQEPGATVACPLVVDNFRAVGWWYRDFSEVGDDDVRAALHLSATTKGRDPS